MKQLFDKSEIETAEKEALTLVSVAAIGKIKTEADMTHAKEVLTSVMNFKKQLQTKKDSIVKPINEALRQIRGLFAPVEEKINQAEAAVKGAILTYNNEVRAKIEVKQAEVAKKVETGEMSVTKAAATLEKVTAKTEAIPTRKQKVVIVENEKLIPLQYWVVDMVAVRRAAMAGIEIPGVKVEEREIIVGGR